MNEMIDIQEITLKPFIMIVEDRKEARETRANFIKGMGCSVITAENASDALKMFMISPQLDLICTDIDLVANDNRPDKSGVSIARFVKQLNNDLPVIGYSSKFADRELTEEEKSYFDGWYDKNGKTMDEYDAMYNYIRDTANMHKFKRFKEISHIFDNLREREIIKSDFQEVLNTALNLGETPIEQIDEAISENGYRLKLITSDTNRIISKPFLVWLREEGNFFEVEIYGYSNLYSYGQTEDEAIENLFYLMKGFASDMQYESEDNIIGPALNIKKFLFNVLNFD